jgi:membrane protein implicated in regulation of membrane protease activity
VDGDGPDINDNVVRLVGHHGHTVGAFVRGEGRVFIDGKEWAATLSHGEDLATGIKVLVTGVDGAKLKVSPIEG